MPKINADTLQELAIVAGFFMLGYGLWQIYPPLAWVICGLLLLMFGAPEIFFAFLLKRKGD